MKELEVKYELSYTFDELDIRGINKWVSFFEDECPELTEKERLEEALYSFLDRERDFSNSEIQAVIRDSLDKIYEWWKENK